MVLRFIQKIFSVPGILSGVLLLASGCGQVNNESSKSVETPVIAAQSRKLPLRYHALVIGIGDYASGDGVGSGWPPLRTAASDARSVGEVLSSDYGFEVTFLLDEAATRSAVMGALDRFMAYDEQDACLVYFAGHGHYEESMDEGFWIPADARRDAGGRATREDWIWNSTLTKIFSASPARHVLVIADSCYSGSLFRGEPGADAPNSLKWYRRAMAAPSRYLLTSGNLEPVLDSGIGHSVFAQEVIDYLRHEGGDVFSISEMGIAVRARISQLTGQLVRLGPMATPVHAGGEFVFVRASVSSNILAALEPASTADETGSLVRKTQRNLRTLVEDALLLDEQGAPRSSRHIMDSLQEEYGSEPLARIAASYLDEDRRSRAHDHLVALIDHLDDFQQPAPDERNGIAHPRPRVLACVGPEASGDREAGARAALYRMCLRLQLEELGGCVVVERENIEAVLREMNLGTSNLADQRAGAAIGRFLPASLVLLGEYLPSESGEDLFLRVVDTETSRVLFSFMEHVSHDADVTAECRRMATRLVNRIRSVKPFIAPVVSVGEQTVTLPLGRFHGVARGTHFDLYLRADSTPGPGDRKVGTARIARLQDDVSVAKVAWNSTSGVLDAGSLYVRETQGCDTSP